MLHDVKLNLGCGNDYIAGWCNVDAVEAVKPDVILDLRSQWIWSDNSVEKVLLKDILEHFTWEDLQKVMAELSRVTKEGAVVTVRVPNLDQIYTQFAKDVSVRNLFIYGATHDTGVFGAHKVGFSPDLLTTLFTRFGFKITSLEKATTNWVATFIRVHDFSIQKVGWCIQSQSWGGAEVYFSELVPALACKTITQTVISNNRKLRSKIHATGVTVRTLPVICDLVANWKAVVKTILFLPHTFFWFVAQAWKLRKKDVVVCATFTDKFFLSPFLYACRVPVVWNEFGPVHPLLKKWFRIPEFLYRLNLHFVERVITPSRHTKQHLSQKMHVSLGLLAKVPCARNSQAIHAERHDAPLSAAEGLRSQTVVCVSRFDTDKGQLQLVEEFAKVVRHIPMAKLVLVGDGKEQVKVQAKIKELGIQKQVECKGFIDSVIHEVQAARMCVFPSRWELEGFGLVAIEAMALGKPVVTYNIAPMNEIILHGETGILVEPTENDGLSEALITLLQSDAMVESMSKKARARFREQYQIERAADEYYDQLLWAVAQTVSRRSLAVLQKKYIL